MKAKKVLGILLVIVGILSFSYAGISYTRREKVLQIGSLVATADRTETLPLPPVVGAVSLVIGVALLAIV
jgi:hypothetical protein